MKTGIFVALAALALTVFAVPDAHAWGGHHHGQNVNQRTFGSILPLAVTDATDASPSLTTSLVTGIAKGQPGKAQVTATLVFETEFVFNPGGDCPDGFPLESNIISFEWAEIYSDGSVLSGEATEGQLLCLDLEITRTVSSTTGTIVGATGRFEGAVGSPWSVEASAPIGSNTFTGTITVDVD